MRARVLDHSEWPRLEAAGVPIAAAVPFLRRDDTRIVVVEDGAGAIVGAWTVIRYVHVEGVWIAPEHRHGTVAGRLLKKMRAVARSWGAGAVLTAAVDDQVRALITSLGGQPLPGSHYVMPVEGPRCRQLSR